MKIKKKFSFTNNRIIWRIVPSGERLLIEERDEKSRQVYFNCLEIESGNSIIRDFQLEEKFWVGIEAFEDDKIYFHKYTRPDMPGHIGITAYSLITKEVLWSRDDIVFQFLYESMIAVYVQKFEQREYYVLDAQTGKNIQDTGVDIQDINILREKSLAKQSEIFKNYQFPQSYRAENPTAETKELIDKLKENVIISGPIDFIQHQGYLLLAFHTVKDEGKLDNNFRLIDIDSRKIIFEDVVNAGITSYIPDVFFIKDNFLFLIKNKTELTVYSLI